MNNIELKTSLGNPDKLRGELKKINANFIAFLGQIDYYFNCKKGRLKLREINNETFELIFYNRPNNKNSKVSNYHILGLDKGQADALKSILISALGLRGVVEKRRELWTYKNTRIHIDKVKNLGGFLELETLVEKAGKSAKKEHQEIIKVLGLDKFKKIPTSYIDLIENALN